MAKKVPSPSAPVSVLPSDSSTEAARIQAPTPAPAPAPAATQYRCTIKDNPVLVLPASNVDEARQKYLLILGITSTENNVTVVALS
jgi:hypothetical protein